MSFAPIALFAYRRTDHLARTLDALEACPEFSMSPVTIYSDAPKSESARADVAAVRSFLVSRMRPNMALVEAAGNLGLGTSIIAGVTEQCRRHGRVIVVEDDLVLSPVALTWLNRGLDQYRENAHVWQVGAHQFPVPLFAGRRSGMFLNLNTSWGWGTWRRAWDRFDPSAAGWRALHSNAALRHQFDLNGAYPYSQMMEDQMAGKVDSWAIRWWWSVFSAGGLGLFPPRSLVTDIGNDSTATHARSRFYRLLAARPQALDRDLPKLPSMVAVDRDAQKAVEAYLRGRNRWPRWKTALKRVGALGA